MVRKGEILLPNRYIPKDIPSEDEDWLNVFIYLDSDDKLIATTEKPKVQVGEFASLKVVEVNSIGVFLDSGSAKGPFASVLGRKTSDDRR